MPHIPGSLDEFERTVEAGLGDIKQTGTKAVKQVGQDVKNQTTKDFVTSLYAPSEQSGTGQPAPQDSGVEEALQGQGGGAQSGGASRSAGQQQQHRPQPQQSNAEQKPESLKSNKEKYGTLADQFPVTLPGQRQESYKPSTGSLAEEVPVLPGILPPHTPTSPLSEQLTGQSDKQDIMKMAGVDPNKPMTPDDKAKVEEVQKQQQQQKQLHDREYAKFGTPLDPIGSLEGQIAKERKKREEEEKKKQQEEQEKKEKKKKEEEQKRRELQPPRGKKTGMPNLAVKKEQTKAEMHRGTTG